MSGKTSSMRSWKYCSSFGEKYIYIIIYIYISNIHSMYNYIYIWAIGKTSIEKCDLGTSLYRFTYQDAYFYIRERSNTYLLHGEFSLSVCVCMLRFKQGVAPDHSGPLPTKTPIWSGDTDWDANLRTCTNFQFHQWQPATPRTGMSIIWRVS